jgi:hypothetical protein
VELFFATPGSAVQAEIGAWQFLTQAGSWRVVLDLFLIGLFGGFYTVPLYALIQTRCAPSHRSRVIAANKFVYLPAALSLNQGANAPSPAADSNSPPAFAPSGANQQFPSPRFSPDA